MRRHPGVTAGTAIAAVGFVLAAASLAGFSVGLPSVQPTTALGASWFMIAVVMLFTGTFVALAARGLELDAAEHASTREPETARPARPVAQLRPVVHLHVARR
jgi:hypothetical protein